MKTMFRKILFSIFIIAAFASCEKNNNEVNVTYFITDSDSGFEVYYRDVNDELKHETVVTQSDSDVWTYSFVADRGDILFMSTVYYDANSKIKARILLDNKVYKEGYSKYDTASFLVVSGTVPYK